MWCDWILRPLILLLKAQPVTVNLTALLLLKLRPDINRLKALQVSWFRSKQETYKFMEKSGITKWCSVLQIGCQGTTWKSPGSDAVNSDSSKLCECWSSGSPGSLCRTLVGSPFCSRTLDMAAVCIQDFLCNCECDGRKILLETCWVILQLTITVFSRLVLGYLLW